MNKINKQECVFCKLYKDRELNKNTEKEVIHETDNLFFVKDIKPEYKVHLLAITKLHIKDFNKLHKKKRLFNLVFDELITFLKFKKVYGLGYRILTNIGKLQSIPHLHIHIHHD